MLRRQGFLDQQLHPRIDLLVSFAAMKLTKKVREMQDVFTFEACQTIKKAAKSKGDERMLHLLYGVNNDLIAAEP